MEGIIFSILYSIDLSDLNIILPEWAIEDRVYASNFNNVNTPLSLQAIQFHNIIIKLCNVRSLS